MQNHVAPLLLAAIAFASCVGDNPDVRGAGDPADRITAEGILADVEVLSADDMEGRAAGTPGAARAAAYLCRSFRADRARADGGELSPCRSSWSA